MKRVALILVMVGALVVSSGVALAAVKFGTGGRDFLVGTLREDVLYGHTARAAATS